MMLTAIASVTATGLFATGIWGVLKARDVLRALISVTLLLSSVTLLTVTLARAQPDPAIAASAQAIVILAWAVEVIEIVIALAIFIALSRRGIIEFARLREGKW
jgi:NADH:ubiquinone oxidoreductase subunit K